MTMINYEGENGNKNNPVDFDYGKALLNQKGGWLVAVTENQLPMFSKLDHALDSRASQAWFWTEEWQTRHNAAIAELESGNYFEFDNGDDFVASLDTIENE